MDRVLVLPCTGHSGSRCKVGTTLGKLRPAGRFARTVIRAELSCRVEVKGVALGHCASLLAPPHCRTSVVGAILRLSGIPGMRRPWLS